MMKKIILICLCIPALLSLNSCELLENPSPREKPVVITYTTYSFIPDNKKEIIVDENFSDNSRNWPTDFPDIYSYLSVSNGFLTLISNSTDKPIATIEVNNLTGKINFEIEARLLIKRNTSDKGNKIIWGHQVSGKQHNFLKINNYKSRFSTGRFDGSKETEQVIENWTGTFYQNDYNTYTIRKVNNQYYYFINGTFLYQEPFTEFKGYHIGFQAGQYHGLYVNHLAFKKLNL